MYEVSSLALALAEQDIEAFIDENMDAFDEYQVSGPHNLDEALAMLFPAQAPDLGTIIEEENDARFVDVTETSKEIRAILADKFKGTKFSVKSKRYSGGQNISISWIDGPADHTVSAAIDHLRGKKSNAYDDSVSYQSTNSIDDDGGVVRRQHTAWINTMREFSEGFLTKIANRVAKDLGVEPPKINVIGKVAYAEETGNIHPGTRKDISEIVMGTARKTSESDTLQESNLAGYIVVEADRVFVPDTATKTVEDWAKRRGVVVRFKKGTDPAASEISMTPQAQQAFIRDFTPGA